MPSKSKSATRPTTSARHVRSYVTSELGFMLDGVPYHRPGQGDKVFNEDFDHVGDWQDGEITWLTDGNYNDHLRVVLRDLRVAKTISFTKDGVNYSRTHLHCEGAANEVYDDELDHVGTWDGEKIVWLNKGCKRLHDIAAQAAADEDERLRQMTPKWA